MNLSEKPLDASACMPEGQASAVLIDRGPDIFPRFGAECVPCSETMTGSKQHVERWCRRHNAWSHTGSTPGNAVIDIECDRR